MELMTQATCIGFCRHTPEMPTSSEMMQAYRQLEGAMQKLGVPPSYFSAYDGTGRGEYKKWEGTFHKKVLEQRMEGIRSFSLAANPTGSKNPGYDSFATIYFGFSPEIRTICVNVIVNHPHLVCGTADCHELINNLSQLRQWDYGFGFERDAATAPDIYLGGSNSNLHSPEDERRTDLWYETSHDFYKGVEQPRRLFMVRDIFPYNMVGLGHLDHRLPDGRSLRELIESDADSEFGQLADNLWLWKVRPDRTEAVREMLLGTGVIISE